MRLLAYRFGSGSGRRTVGVTSAADDGSCWSLWLGQYGTAEAMRHNSADLCDEYIAKHLGAWEAEGWVLDTRPVVMEAIDLPPDIDEDGNGREHINWAEHVLMAVTTMFATMKTTTPSPYRQKLKIDVTFASPSPGLLDLLRWDETA